MVLIVGKSLLHHDIQHGTRIGDGHLGLLLITGLHHKVFREGVGEDTPDTISVQLQWPPEEGKFKRNTLQCEIHFSLFIPVGALDKL